MVFIGRRSWSERILIWILVTAAAADVPLADPASCGAGASPSPGEAERLNGLSLLQLRDAAPGEEAVPRRGIVFLPPPFFPVGEPVPAAALVAPFEPRAAEPRGPDEPSAEVMAILSHSVEGGQSRIAGRMKGGKKGDKNKADKNKGGKNKDGKNKGGKKGGKKGGGKKNGGKKGGGKKGGGKKGGSKKTVETNAGGKKPTAAPTPEPTLTPTPAPTAQPTEEPPIFPTPESGCKIVSWKDVPNLPGGEGKAADGKHLPSLRGKTGAPGGRLENVGFIKTPCDVKNPHEGTCAGLCAAECEANPFCQAFEFIDAGTQYLGRGVRSDSGNDYYCKQFQAGSLGPVVSTSSWSHGKRGEQPGSVGVCGKPGTCEVAEGSCFKFYSVSVQGKRGDGSHVAWSGVKGGVQLFKSGNSIDLRHEATEQFATHTRVTLHEATPVDAIGVLGSLENFEVMVNGSHTGERWVTLTAPYTTIARSKAAVGKPALGKTFVLRRDDGSCVSAGPRGKYKLCRSSRSPCDGMPKVESGAFGEGCVVYKMTATDRLFRLQMVSDTEPEDVCLAYDMSYDPDPSLKGVKLNHIPCKYGGIGWVTSTWNMDRNGRVCAGTNEGSSYAPADLPIPCSANGKSCSVRVACLWAVPPT